MPPSEKGGRGQQTLPRRHFRRGASRCVEGLLRRGETLPLRPKPKLAILRGERFLRGSQAGQQRQHPPGHCSPSEAALTVLLTILFHLKQHTGISNPPKQLCFLFVFNKRRIRIAQSLPNRCRCQRFATKSYLVLKLINYYLKILLGNWGSLLVVASTIQLHAFENCVGRRVIFHNIARNFRISSRLVLKLCHLVPTACATLRRRMSVRQ